MFYCRDMALGVPPSPQPSPGHLDLGTQLEDLLVHVFECEKQATREDRIDLSLRLLRDI